MTTPTPEERLGKTVQLLAHINRLTLKAFQVKNAQELIFLILNDTVPIVRYDRAVLWKLDPAQRTAPTILGISGQASVPRETDLSRRWTEVVKGIESPGQPQVIKSPEIATSTSLLWLPIFAYEQPVLGLWLERWNNVPWTQDEVEVLKFLTQAYGGAWEKFTKKFAIQDFVRRPLPIVLLGVLALCMFLRVPLRVVAPCEVVPKEPIVVTAPLEGIIDRITVDPGQPVKKGTLLFEYDKRVPLQSLRVQQKKVDIIRSEVDRVNALAQSSIRDKKALAELAVQMLKLKKEQLELELAEYHASQLEVTSPIDGVAMLDNPEEWRGKPVKIGEKVMLVSDPAHTKIRMWIPEEDNVVLNMKVPVQIFLNINPEQSYPAHLIYIANYTTVTEKQVTSFLAEAEWVDKQPEGVKLGLKGTAILYGEKVSLFYWIIRKPWAYVRRFFGF